MHRFERASGILAHPTVLPGPHGIGDLGSTAFAFVDRLADAKQRLWQLLPLTPTGFANSPYSSPSAFAGNPLLISFERLLEHGVLREDELAELADLPADRVDYGQLIPLKQSALRLAFERLQQSAPDRWRDQLQGFREQESDWLDDYTLFATLSEKLELPWTEWDPPLRDRQPWAMREVFEQFADDLTFHAFCQYLFFEQWDAVRRYANDRGIRIVGDIPIFVAHNSADVWAHRDLFKLDPEGMPVVVSGVPPDYFSETGQLWGNPHYDWPSIAESGFEWWVQRFRQTLRQVDVVRVDHFRGFASAWEVRAGAPNAVEGAWVSGPGSALFHTVDEAIGGRVPVIAEDLGLVTEDVVNLLEELALPGMRVLQFAFGDDAKNPHLPHNFADPNCVVYTGTHDNDTTLGWLETASEHELRSLRHYVAGPTEDAESMELSPWQLIRLAIASTADLAITPLADVLGLPTSARMNTPGTPEGNWEHRVTSAQLDAGAWGRLRSLSETFGRA